MKRLATPKGFKTTRPSGHRPHIVIETFERRMLMSVSVIQDLSVDPRANGQPAYDQFVVSNGIGFFKRFGASDIGSFWTTNGITATEIMGASPGGSLHEMLPVKAGIVAVDNGPFGNKIWRSDGTVAGTYVVGTINIVHSTPGLSPAQSFNGKYYINSESGNVTIAVTDGNTFWTGFGEQWTGMAQYSNGVVFNGLSGMLTLDNNGTITRIADFLSSGDHYVFAREPFNVQHGVVFLVSDEQQGHKPNYTLWVTDGTKQNTEQLPVIFPGTPQSVSIIGSDGQHALIDVTDPDGNDAIWSTDGTAQGTMQIIAGPAGRDFDVIGDVNGRMLFTTRPEYLSSDVTLWSTQGTAATTRQVARFDQPFYPSFQPPYNYESIMWPDRFVLWNGFAYFVASEPQHGAEIWQTDGTAAGTHLAVDVVPGPESSFPILDGVVGGRLVFNGVPSVGAAPTLLAYDPRLRPVPIHTPVHVTLPPPAPDSLVASAVAKHSKLDAIDLLDGAPGLS